MRLLVAGNIDGLKEVLKSAPASFFEKEFANSNSALLPYFSDEQTTQLMANIPTDQFKDKWNSLPENVKDKIDQSKFSEEQLKTMSEFGSLVPAEITIFSQFRASGSDYVGGRTHSGQDYSLGTGTPITVNISGTVVGVVTGKANTYPNRSFGNYVKIEDSEGRFHLYAHLSSVKVAVGDEINVGDALGNSGNSSGSHLHYEVPPDDAHWDNSGTALNPNDFIEE